MEPRVWNLRTPQTVISRVLRELRLGRNVILLVNDLFPSGFFPALQEAGMSSFHHEFVLHHEDSGIFADPLSDLVDQYAIDRTHWGSDIEAIQVDDGFESRVFVVHPRGTHRVEAWFRAVSRYAQVCQGSSLSRRPLILLVVSNGMLAPEGNVALEVLKLPRVVTPLDLHVLIDNTTDVFEERPLADSVAHSVIVELAIWDAGLALFLASRPLRDLLRPKPALLEYAETLGWRHATEESDLRRLEAMGATLSDGERPLAHSCYLALSNKGAEIAARVWLGQLRVLFPLVEEVRQTFLKNYGVSLGPEEAFEDLEIGQVWAKVSERQRSFPPSVVDLVRTTREIRNSLAHRSALDVHQLARFADLISRCPFG